MQALAVSSPRIKSKNWIPFVVLSIGLHALIVLGLKNKTITKLDPVSVIPQITAELVYFPRIEEQEVIANESKETTSQEEFVRPANDANASIKAVPETISTPQFEQETTNSNQPLNPDSDTSRRPGTSISQALNHIRNLNNQSLSTLSQQNADEYRYQQRHPNITETKGGEFQYIETVPPPVTAKEVNCDNALVKGVKFISFFTGGRLKCAEGPDINSFIDKRMKK